MAPSGRTTTTTAAVAVAANSKMTTTRTRRRTRQPRKTNFKKQHRKSKRQEIPLPTVFPSSSTSSSQDSSKEGGDNELCEVIDDVSNTNRSACSTPKGHKFRIPEISTCPPAPKKPRVLSSNCSLRRSSLSFFSPPDLEQFFFVALRDVSV